MNKKDILKLLETVQYPGFSRNIISFGMVGDISINGDKIEIELKISTQNDEKKYQVVESVKSKLKDLFKDVDVKINSKSSQPQVSNLNTNDNSNSTLKNVKNIIAVASGKGGVGKSTVSANLACSLSNEGKKVGLLDLDIYGPSLPIIFGINEQPLMTQNKKLIPIEKYNLRLMSFGFISGNKTPVIWRGPLVARMTEQFFRDVEWGNLDYLILDLPPGTGDIQLTLTQKLQISGALIITTPQDIALADVRKGADMFQKVNAPVLGVIESMSGFVLEGSVQGDSSYVILNGKKIKIEKDGTFNHKIDLFKSGGGIKESERLGVPLLGEIPFSTDLINSTDDGMPISKKEPTSYIGEVFKNITKKIIKIVE